MTGTFGSASRAFMDLDSRKNQEWLRRRKLRLEQVRKQSNEIAKAVRQKVITGKKLRLKEHDKASEENFRDWKTEKLDKLELKLRCALEEFGEGYKLAEAEPDATKIIDTKSKINFMNAKKRGEIALQEEHRIKKMTEEKKMSPIIRKKLTRKKEDLRSALIRSVPLKKHFLSTQKVHEENIKPQKTSVCERTKKAAKSTKGSSHPDAKKKSGKIKRKKRASTKPHLDKQKEQTCPLIPQNPDTVWINLNEIQSSSTGGFGQKSRSSDTFAGSDRKQKEKPDGAVEFYDFSSRYHCKTYRDFPYSVERVTSESQEPNATELAEMENENAKEEAKKREVIDTLTQVRGAEALRREKISRNYCSLISKLEELNKKEKVLRAQQQNIPNYLHMSDERLLERFRMRQRMMNSKFEDIYYANASEIPVADPGNAEVPHCQGGGDWAAFDDLTSNSLSLSPSNPKPNTPVMSEEKISSENSAKEKTHRPMMTADKRQLLKDIEKTIREGRELRKSVIGSREETDLEESQKENSSSGSDSGKSTRLEASQVSEGHFRRTTRSQECQTENLKEQRHVEIDASLPMSTSTCYKSPPSFLRSHRVQQFLECLGISEPEDYTLAEGKEALKKKIDKLMQDLMYDGNHKSAKTEEKSKHNQTLEYYITKLLNMSRECVADLSVSSENISTPNITELDLEEPEAKCPHEVPVGEELIRKSRLNRADYLEEMIATWKRALEKSSKPEPEDVPDCATQCDCAEQPEDAVGKGDQDNVCVIYAPKFKNKYEEITKKCSERISELSSMLDKVRKDKEKLLSSASGGSTSSLSKDGKDSDKEIEEDEETEKNSKFEVPIASPVRESFVNRHNFEPRGTATSPVANYQNPEESLESWPDVMEELLKKKILTSPFKWSEGEYSSEFGTNDNRLQLPSIEKVIGNFRKEISKIKPFTVSDTLPKSNSPQKPRHAPEEGPQKFSYSPRRISFSRPLSGELYQEETSVESINQALTSLGLNWAKSVLRKNEESKAMSSSSDSETKTSDSD